MKILPIIASALLYSSLICQTQSPTDSTGTASIITEPAGADVYVDSLFIGKSPVRGFILTRGLHRIRVFYPSVFAWNAIVMQDTLVISGVDQQEKRLTLGEVLRVRTEPPNGIVRYGGTVLGPTPLYARIPSVNAGDIVIQRDGYDSLLVPAGEIHDGLLKAKLSPRKGVSSQQSDVLGVNGAIPRDYTITYVSGATMIVSGVASAIIKDRANRRFDSYLQSNDAADLSTTRRLDRWAAATLIVSQISFAVLAYFLLSE